MPFLLCGAPHIAIMRSARLCRVLAVVEIDDAVIDRFGRHRCRCPGIRRVKGVSERYVKRARRFVEFLSERSIVRSKPKSTSPAFDRHVIEFQEWLRQHRGITELTIGRHGRMVMRLLRHSAESREAGTPNSFAT